MFCFDVMFLNGSDVMAKPLSERRQILERIVVKGGRILLTDSIRASSAEQISRFFDESVSQGLEGIIAKDLHAPYVAGARKFAWIKLKRSYKGELSDTVDVVVVGYFSGQGKRTQFGLGGLLSAVYNREQERFESIAKIGTGMTEQMLSDLEETLSKSKRKSKPGNVVCNIEPDFWVEPKMVLEVRADEITKSPIHTAGADDGPEGFALRFPRLVKIRDDKGPTDITTVEEIKKMFSLQGKQPVDAGVASEES
jgi:DNA ligase-1